MALRRDPYFTIVFPNWDTFSQWEWRPDRRASYLGDANWDRNWTPAASSSSHDDDDEDDFPEHDGHGCTSVQVQASPPLPSPSHVSGEVSR
jgi:hypothetical protein